MDNDLALHLLEHLLDRIHVTFLLERLDLLKLVVQADLLPLLIPIRRRQTLYKLTLLRSEFVGAFAFDLLGQLRPAQAQIGVPLSLLGLLGAFALLPLPLIAPALGLPFFAGSLVFMLLYLWSR